MLHGYLSKNGFDLVSLIFPLEIDTSGKSPAQCHHRKNCEARAADGRGLFQFSVSDGGRTSRRHIFPRNLA